MTAEGGAVARLRGLVTQHEEKVRFLFAGMFNTALGYALFALLLALFGKERYNAALGTQWAISVSISYVVFKRFVFKTRGTNWLGEWLRSYIVYAASLAINLLLLNLFVIGLHLHPLFAQLACIFLVTILSYVGHKYFTFRHVPEPVGLVEPMPDVEEVLAQAEGDEEE
jgi:putative flippase GtrA